MVLKFGFTLRGPQTESPRFTRSVNPKLELVIFYF